MPWSHRAVAVARLRSLDESGSEMLPRNASQQRVLTHAEVRWA